MTDLTCQLCRNPVETIGLCFWCNRKLHRQLDDLYIFWKAAHDELLPGKSGSGGRSSERTIGLNVNALSFVAGDDILNFLHEWEKLIRELRSLTPPALLSKKPTLDAEIQEAVRFARVHLVWSAGQDWIGDFASELRDVHELGKVASKFFMPKATTIPCPTTLDDGSECGRKVKIDKENPLANFTCSQCNTEWNTLRIIAVALDSEGETIWLDADAIASYLGIVTSSVHKFAKRNNINRRGELYDFRQLVAIRKKAI